MRSFQIFKNEDVSNWAVSRANQRLVFASDKYNDKTIMIFYYEENSTALKNLIFRIPEHAFVNSYHEYSNCIDTVNYHLIKHDSEIAILVSDREDCLLKGIRISSAKDTHLPCVGGLDVQLVAMMANSCVLRCEQVEYKIRDETASTLQADKIHEKSGMTDYKFFENIDTTVNKIREGTENADDKFMDFWKGFIWLRDKMMSDEKVEGENLGELKGYVELLGKWSHGNNVISTIKETLKRWVAMAEDDDEIEIYFKYMSVYPIEKVMFELKGNDAATTRSNFKFYKHPSINIPYFFLRNNETRKNIFCECPPKPKSAVQSSTSAAGYCNHKIFFDCDYCDEKIVGLCDLKVHMSKHKAPQAISFGRNCFANKIEISDENLLEPVKYGIKRMTVSLNFQDFFHFFP